jgi:precorrin-4/cobalt-precorrin-4 C11-methyltransferase
VKIMFVGAGPGDLELITVKGRRLISEAEIVIYAGSLVDPAILAWMRPEAKAFDSSGMTLEQVCEIYASHAATPGLIVRLHAGDPSIYGTIREQMDFCIEKGLDFEIVPGVSSVFASAAAAKCELTVPGVTQSVVLTRMPGRTDVPSKERMCHIAPLGTTIACFLSADSLDRLVAEATPSRGLQCPVVVVHRASWPDQQIIRGTLGSIVQDLYSVFGIASMPKGQVMVMIGEALGVSDGMYEKSRLYDPSFSHGWRKGVLV